MARMARTRTNLAGLRSLVKPTFFLPLLLSISCCFAQDNFHGWETVGGTAANLHYSSLRQINKSNVSRLRVAWTYDSGDAYPNSDVQCNPIVIDGVMYVTTAKLDVVDLDAATGKQRWRFTDGNRR